jgi:hypothetical protein
LIIASIPCLLTFILVPFSFDLSFNSAPDYTTAP